ncbi:MAG: LysM peptidoglycan-binding domain-containing protein [Caldilineales bacterium]|nr:LysM peptidoglycan-binding domain-containing protein [Caldilineales bacterium]MDW8317572.1 LysM domain-containing protein [Anaerolineae bacterium]
MKTRKSAVLAVGLLLALLLSLLPASGAPLASSGDVLVNGGFEGGFVAVPGCGMVGAGWGCFTNGGAAFFGFYDDMWQPVVHSGKHSQLIEINTKERGGDPDRNAGIYQRVFVHPGATYQLSLKGMIRADERNTSDPWRYRVYVGFDYSGGTDWTAVRDWRELPWDTYYPRTRPGSFSSYLTNVVPTSGHLTVFIRVQRKWGEWYEETDFNLDSISLFGPLVKVPVVKPPVADGPPMGDPSMPKPPVVVYPPHPEPPQVPPVEPPVVPPILPPIEPPKPPALVCDGPNLLWNGNFELGFRPDGVGNYWASFTNGGRANYGFYDDRWPPVVSEGKHSQLIEINTLGLSATDPDRKAGIFQRVYLQPGVTYEISLDAMMRERGVFEGEDFYRYLVEWGYSAHGAMDPNALTYHNMVKLDRIYEREAPGAMQSYKERFVAPSHLTTIWVFAVKKWATLERELDVNVDNIALRACRYVTPQLPEPPIYPPKPPHHGKPPVVKPPIAKPACTDPGDIWYQVQRGDTLSALAVRYNTSVAAIVAKNGLRNPNVIYVGQWLCIPDPPAQAAAGASTAAAPAAAPAAAVSQPTASAPATASAATAAPGTYRVQRGDTLSGIAARFNTTVDALARLNGITNPNHIYAGQLLRLP